MDRTAVSGTADTGSIPVGSARQNTESQTDSVFYKLYFGILLL